MADYYTKFSTELDVRPEEAALLKAALDVDWTEEGDVPSPLSNIFATREAFINTVFDEHNRDWPYFGVDAEINVNQGLVQISGENPNLEALANLIQQTCRETVRRQPIGFSFSHDCTKMRPDAFGGGWCAIGADEIKWGSTDEALAIAVIEVASPDFEIEEPAE